MLVIACPCAIVLAAPIATVSALTSATREGILFKGAQYLEAMGKVRAIAFDKTGTLTHGRLRVTRIMALPDAGATEEEILRLACAVEAGSAHPIAEAIRREATRRKVATSTCGTTTRTFSVIEGRGARAEIDGKMVYVGNADLFGGIDYLKTRRLIDASISSDGPLIFVGVKDFVFGAIWLADQARINAPETISALRKLGIQRLVMLTGDCEAAARNISAAVGINETAHGLLPEDKLEQIRSIIASHGAVAMVGDGVNDAPALAAATVGISMAAAGSPAAMETADVALLTEDLRKIPYAVAMGRRMILVIRQNVFISIAVKVGFLGLAAAGFSTLWMAVIADMGTSLFVVFNGMRLLASPKNSQALS